LQPPHRIAEVPPLADIFALSSSFLPQSISRNKSSIIWFRPNNKKIRKLELEECFYNVSLTWKVNE
jgi:hypothetical protein